MTKLNSEHIAVIGAGFIGKHLIRALLDDGHILHVLDHNDCPVEFSDQLLWVKGDLNQKSQLSRVLAGTTTVYHLVSSTVPGDQQIDIATELSQNVFSTLDLLEMCKISGVKRLIFSSSASVYGVQKHFPVSENALCWPISTHGIHKLTIEKFLWLAHYEKKIEVRILRISNPYGPGQKINGRQGFIAIAIGALLNNSKLILRDGGNTIRDFIYIGDVTAALVAAGNLNNLPLVLNIGAGQGYKLNQVIKVIEELTGKSLNIEHAKSRNVDIPVSILNTEMAKSSLGISSQTTLVAGITETLEYYNSKII